ncbi:permease [Agromyces luteolus]|uniref:FtsX-like permease family protein n=1 Tax=Agromyces luteolus TaxID=88373 RepID=A0A7C9LUM7_9MICO|nr:ABC transporter permease [Agromyces luteolus]MUN08576.1 FtsX-like permease family protein [Agromyces luteolus]GLK27112.1 permease [Agromyces luteolus]
MKTIDLVRTGVRNTFRSRARTTLTVLAIFVGAFTLTITSGLGTGINRYIDDTVAAIGGGDVLTVTKVADEDFDPTDTSPQEYDPNAVTTGDGIARTSIEMMTQDDLDAIGDVDDILDVEPITPAQVDYVSHDDGTRYTATVSALTPGQTVQTTAGAEPENGTTQFQISLPPTYVEPLGFDDDTDAIGATLTIAVTDGAFEQHTVDAEIVGVTEETLAGPGGASLIANQALQDELVTLQSTGLPDDQLDQWAQATATFDPELTPDEVDALKEGLADEGFSGTTTADTLGAFTTVIDTIVLILNAFAGIALLAAGFGIVNTLLMSVQERTREIGLMKAMGMSSGRVFGLFSIEAVFIGFLGSAIGVITAMIVGTAVSGLLAGALLANLPGLTLIAFDPITIGVTILVIMAVAFLAGTLPAARAARKDPVDALRYE